MKKKLELNKLKANSFVTELNKSNEQTIKGGMTAFDDRLAVHKKRH